MSFVDIAWSKNIILPSKSILCIDCVALWAAQGSFDHQGPCSNCTCILNVSSTGKNVHFDDDYSVDQNVDDDHTDDTIIFNRNLSYLTGEQNITRKLWNTLLQTLYLLQLAVQNVDFLVLNFNFCLVQKIDWALKKGNKRNGFSNILSLRYTSTVHCSTVKCF